MLIGTLTTVNKSLTWDSNQYLNQWNWALLCQRSKFMDSLLLKSGWFIQNNNNEMVQYGGKIKEKLLHVTPVAVKGLYIEKNPAYGRHRWRQKHRYQLNRRSGFKKN